MLKRCFAMVFCLCVVISTTACSQRNDSSSHVETTNSEKSSTAVRETEQISRMDEVLSEPDDSEQQTVEKISLHIKGEEEGSGALILDAPSIQEIADYLHNLQPSNFQGELKESYILQVKIFFGDTIEEYEITAEGLVNGKVLACKIDSPNNTNDSLSSNSQYKWFLVDANIWKTIDPHIYLPFTYENDDFISRPSDLRG